MRVLMPLVCAALVPLACVAQVGIEVLPYGEAPALVVVSEDWPVEAMVCVAGLENGAALEVAFARLTAAGDVALSLPGGPSWLNRAYATSGVGCERYRVVRFRYEPNARWAVLGYTATWLIGVVDGEWTEVVHTPLRVRGGLYTASSEPVLQYPVIPGRATVLLLGIGEGVYRVVLCAVGPDDYDLGRAVREKYAVATVQIAEVEP